MLITCKRSIAMLALSLCVLTAMQGCSGGTATPPSRPKLPERLNTLQGYDNNGPVGASYGTDLPFRTDFMSLETTTGSATTFFALSLPDGSSDAAIMNLANIYRPLAATLLSQWITQQPYPVAIDLRGANSVDTHRTDYLVRVSAGTSIPVSILWDSRSAGRACSYRQLLFSVPEVQVLQVAGEGTNGYSNCFAPTAASL